MKVILETLMKVILETLMKVILETRHEGYSRNTPWRLF
jgi:hypothetical protein